MWRRVLVEVAMIINYKDYYNKAKGRKSKYKKDKKLDAMLDKLYEWYIQDARNQAKEGKVVFLD